jgi:hypothetical protein
VRGMESAMGSSERRVKSCECQPAGEPEPQKSSTCERKRFLWSKSVMYIMVEGLHTFGNLFDSSAC